MNHVSNAVATEQGRRRWRAALMASTMGVLLALPPLGGAHAQALPAAPVQQTLPSLAPIVDKVMPAVVNISVTLKNDSEDAEADSGMPIPGFPENSPFDEFLRRFFEHQGFPPNGGRAAPRGEMGRRVALGSGFIVDPSGYVVTNNHVVGQADKVTVVLQDDSKHPAKIVGRDEKTDIALLKIDTKKPLPYVQWGDSDAAKVGDWVIAVGNPFGLGGSVTAGIISARGRDLNAGPFDNFLQIDAPINRGNSGGPTFNQRGDVVGINTAIYSPNGGSVGIGFAIPSNLAKTIVAQLRDHGNVERGWLGVKVQGITPDIAKSLGLDPDNPQGALVAEVTPGSPAAKAGIRQGDVITQVNGKAVDKLNDLPRLIADAGIGKTVELGVRRDGAGRTLTATLSQPPRERQVARDEQEGAGGERGGQAQPATASALGLRIAPLDQAMRQRLGLGKDVKGVVVADVAPDSPLADTGVQPGDVIVSINQKPVASPAEAARGLREVQQGSKHALLLINRHGAQQFVGLSLDDSGQG